MKCRLNFASLCLLAAVNLAAVANCAEDAAKAVKSDQPTPASIDELLLFFPTKYPAGNWAPEGLRLRNVWFTAEDKTRLHGWYCPCENPRATILIAHGNAGNIADRASWLKYLQSKLRVSTLIFDYRGFGRSDGVPTVDGVLQDTRAARTKLSEITRVPRSRHAADGPVARRGRSSCSWQSSPPRAA